MLHGILFPLSFSLFFFFFQQPDTCSGRTAWWMTPPLTPFTGLHQTRLLWKMPLASPKVVSVKHAFTDYLQYCTFFHLFIWTGPKNHKSEQYINLHVIPDRCLQPCCFFCFFFAHTHVLLERLRHLWETLEIFLWSHRKSESRWSCWPFLARPRVTPPSRNRSNEGSAEVSFDHMTLTHQFFGGGLSMSLFLFALPTPHPPSKSFCVIQRVVQ